jgi:hypothetical protein
VSLLQSKIQRKQLVVKATRIATNSFGLTIVLGIFAFAQTMIFGSRFGANDDFGMAQISNGGFTGRPSEYLIFINVILGHILKLCYQLVPGIQWYPLLQVASMAFAFAVFIRLAFSALRSLIPFESILRRYFASTLIVVVLAQFIVWVYNISFSTTAFFCSALGLSALFLSLRINHNSLAITPIAVCFLGFLWRNHAFISVVPIFLLVLVFQFRKILFLSFFKNIISLTFVILLGSYLDRLAYTSSDKWRAFYEYNLLRGKVHGNSVITSLIDRFGLGEIASVMQIPVANLKLFSHWIYSSSTTPVVSLQRAVALIEEHTLLSQLQIGSIALSQATGILLLITPITILILLAYSRARITLISLLLAIFTFLILAESYLEQFIRLPGTVIEGLRFSTLIGLLMLLMFALNSDEGNFHLNRVMRFFLLFSFLPFAIYGIHLIRVVPDVSGDTKLQQKQLFENTQEFQQDFSQPTIDFLGLVDTAVSSPWSSFRLNSLKLMPVGWMASSPHENERLSFYGINDDLAAALSTGRISVVDAQGSFRLALISEYLFANYKICGTWDTTSITFRDQPVSLSRFTRSQDCLSVVYSDPRLEHKEIFHTIDIVHLQITYCSSGLIENRIQFKALSPFDPFAKDFRIKIDYLGPSNAPTTRYVTVKPGNSQQLVVETWGCDVQVTSLSPPIVPIEMDPNIPDRRNLYVGITDLAILSD